MKETKPKINNLSAFQKALKDYEMSDSAKQVLRDTRLVVMSGLSGGGRNTLINHLAKQHNYAFVISDTTRQPKFRNGEMEQDGVNYNFRNEEDMLTEILRGEFIEAEIIHNQQVSGTSIRELEKVAKTGKIPTHDYEFGGANHIAQAKPDADIIGLLPPNYTEWLYRFQAREIIRKEELLNRIATAEKVLENMLRQTYFKYVINDDIKQSAADVRDIVENGRYTKEAHERGRSTANNILERIKHTLANPSDNILAPE